MVFHECLYSAGWVHPELIAHFSEADEANRYLLYFVAKLLLVFFPHTKFQSCTHEAVACTLMIPPHQRMFFLWWPKAPLREHSCVCCWAVNEWVKILVNWSYWAPRLFIFCDLSSDCRWVCSAEILVRGIIVLLHIDTFNERHSLWACQTLVLCCQGEEWTEMTPSIKSSIFSLSVSFLGQRHFFCLRLTRRPNTWQCRYVYCMPCRDVIGWVTSRGMA